MLGAADSHEGGIQATGVTELSTGAHAKSANLIDAATVSGGQKLAGMVAAAVTPSADPMGISAKAQGPPGLGSTRTHRRRTLRKLAWMRMATTINETTLKLTQLMAPSAVTPRKDSQGDAFGPVTTTPRANNKQQQLATVGPRTQLQQSATIADAVASGIGEHHGMAKNETEHSTACKHMHKGFLEAQTQTAASATNSLDYYYDVAVACLEQQWRPWAQQPEATVTQEQIWDECLDRLADAADIWAAQCSNIPGRMGARWSGNLLTFTAIDESDGE
mmetsp:Transcript_6017/g.11596  ORF Transcript_6017/g.11596 Transcript_6017/m.11596 type:complete len:276 (-) Transcript_6017:4-831(-)